jgi:selenocysteine lyase/cysteine desulfurase
MAQRDTRERTLTELELLQLQRLNTPTIYNGWEQITRHDVARDAFNIEGVRTFSAVRRLNMRRLCCLAGAAPAR